VLGNRPVDAVVTATLILSPDLAAGKLMLKDFKRERQRERERES
jgi:urease accessory protein UreE